MCKYAIGQIYVMATPIQVLRAFAGVACRGKFLPRPYLVVPAPPESLPPMKESTIATIWDGMRQAVADPRGTVGKIEYGLHRFNIAAKTGTAQFRNEDKIYHAWLGGFGPLPEPKFAFVVALEESREYGGRTCAPLVWVLLDYLSKEYAGLLPGGEPDGSVRPSVEDF